MIGLVFAGIGAASIALYAGITGAIFTDTATVDENTFTTGELDIATAPTSAAVTFTGMVPGDVVTGPITVTNGGTVQLRYAVTSTTTEDVLAGQLDLTVKTGVTDCTTAGFSGSGTVLYGPADLGNTTAINVIGDPAQGAQAGDRVLDPAGSEILCLQVLLPLSTGDTFQGLTTTATFDFLAEQTANNP